MLNRYLSSIEGITLATVENLMTRDSSNRGPVGNPANQLSHLLAHTYVSDRKSVLCDFLICCITYGTIGMRMRLNVSRRITG